MAETSSEFSQLMQRVKAGSEDAVREILDRYGDGLLRVIRRRLNQQLRSQFDSDDFYQAVWTSFFAHRDELSRFESPQDLEAFLKTVAGHKVIDQTRRRLMTKAWSTNREVSSSAIEMRPPASQDPTPSTVVAFQDEVDQMPLNHQRIVELRNEGWTLEEIAAKTGVNERTVRRVLKKLADRMTND